MAFEFFAGADTRELQQLRRVKCAAAENHLSRCPRLSALALIGSGRSVSTIEIFALKILDPDRALEIADQVGPMRRMGRSDEMAAIILFLCSPAARFVNGADLVADGGEMRANWFTFFERGDL